MILGERTKKLNEARIARISKIALFNEWIKPTLAALSNYILLRGYKSGEYIYSKGDHIDYIYIVVQGEVEIIARDDLLEHNSNRKYKLLKTNKKTNEYPLIKIPEGGYFGDENRLTSSPSNFAVRAIHDQTLLYLIPLDVVFV